MQGSTLHPNSAIASMGGVMSSRTRVRVLCVVLALGMMAAPAAAQLVNGTVSGTVKDPQGSTIPGATVVLVNESRGTQLPPAFTNANGDFVLANVPPDTYTLQVTL